MALTKQLKKEFDFDGQSFIVTAKRLKRKQMIQIAPLLATDDKGNVVLEGLKEQLEFVDIGADIVRKQVCDMGEFYIYDELYSCENDNHNVDLYEDVIFTGLVSDLFQWIMQNSFLGESAEKKPESLQESTLQVMEVKPQMEGIPSEDAH